MILPKNILASLQLTTFKALPFHVNFLNIPVHLMSVVQSRTHIPFRNMVVAEWMFSLKALLHFGFWFRPQWVLNKAKETYYHVTLLIILTLSASNLLWKHKTKLGRILYDRLVREKNPNKYAFLNISLMNRPISDI